MFGALASVVGMNQRIVRSAQVIRIPRRRRHRRTRRHRVPAGPGLVPGLGLARRRPRLSLSRLLAEWFVYLLVTGAFVSLALNQVL